MAIYRPHASFAGTVLLFSLPQHIGIEVGMNVLSAVLLVDPESAAGLVVPETKLVPDVQPHGIFRPRQTLSY